MSKKKSIEKNEDQGDLFDLPPSPKVIKKKKNVEVMEQPVEQGVAEAASETSPAPDQVQINLDLVRTMRPRIAMPCFGGSLYESTMMSLLQWSNLAHQVGINWTIETLASESLVCRARDTLTSKFMVSANNEDPATAPNCLIFVDADISFKPEHLLMLLEALAQPDIDIIAGLYPLKSLPINFCINGKENAEERGPLLEVAKAGTGFFGVKTSVFEHLKSHPSIKPYRNDLGLPQEIDAELYNYWQCPVRGKAGVPVSEGGARMLSEDWYFCQMASELGIKTFVDRRITLTHSGYYKFSQESWNEIQAKVIADYQANLANSGYRLVGPEEK